MRLTLDAHAQIDDVDNCTVFYNYAVILYRLQQHHSAIEVLLKVFGIMEPIGKQCAVLICDVRCLYMLRLTADKLCQRVVFLLIDLYLATQQVIFKLLFLIFCQRALLVWNFSSRKRLCNS